MRVAAIVFLFLIGLRFPRSNQYQIFYAKDIVRVHSKEYENLKNLIIVYAKLNWIWNFYYSVETAMSYLIF